METLMKPIATTLCCGVVLLIALGAQPAAEPPHAKPREPDVRKLTLQLRAPSQPELRYRLLPAHDQLTPGNAVPVYMTALLLLAQMPQEWLESLDRLGQLPLTELPVEETRQFLDSSRSILDLLHIAARRERSEWDLTWREQGFQSLLPHLNRMRTVSWLLSIESRLAIADGRFEDAAHSIQKRIAMVQHLQSEALLIEALVAASIAGHTAEDLELFIQQPQSPNLYWPLAILPGLATDFAAIIQRESLIAQQTYPFLAQADAAPIDEATARSLLLDIAYPDPATRSDVTMQEFEKEMEQAYELLLPPAKKHFADKGVPPEQIGAMSPLQAIMRYMLDDYQEWVYHSSKWYALPFWQAYPGLLESEQELESRQQSSLNVLLALQPPMSRAFWGVTKPQRRVALLQTIEALRAHAAEHDGQLPEDLHQVRLPLPADPVTGRPFEYERAEHGFVLTGPAPRNLPADALRYEVTLK
jgi:hypothetical protein